MVRVSFAALLGLLPFALARTRTIDLTVSNTRIAPDGFERK
jgi:hypothetical protein